jgi:hypothetical protein
MKRQFGERDLDARKYRSLSKSREYPLFFGQTLERKCACFCFCKEYRESFERDLCEVLQD